MGRLVGRYKGVTSRPGLGPVGRGFLSDLTPPFTRDISEAYFIPGGSVTDTQVTSPYADPATLVKSYCAKGDGASTFATLTTPIVIASTFDWTIEFFHVHASNANDRVFFGSSAKTTSYGLQLRSNNTLMMFDDGFITGTNTFDNNLVAGKTYKITVTWRSGVHRIVVWNESDSILHSDKNSTLSGGSFSLSIDLLGKRGNNDRYGIHPWFDLKITTPTTSLRIPAQGSLFDVSGNNNHAVHIGVNLFQRQDFFHYNITKGWGLGPESFTNTRFEDWTGGNPDGWLVFGRNATNLIQEHPNGIEFTFDGATSAGIYQSLTPGFYRITVEVLSITGSFKIDGGPVEDAITSTGVHTFYRRTTTALNLMRRSGLTCNAVIRFVSTRVDFIPRLADDSGWAAPVAEEHLAGNWHNQAETFVRFPYIVSSYAAKTTSFNGYIAIPPCRPLKNKPFKMQASCAPTGSSLPFGSVSGLVYVDFTNTRTSWRWGSVFARAEGMTYTGGGVPHRITLEYDGNPTGVENFTFTNERLDTGATQVYKVTADITAYGDNREYDALLVGVVGSAASAGNVWDCRIWLDGELFGHWPLQGSLYDVSGNGRHGAIAGVSPETVTLNNLQNFYFYNSEFGYDLYLKDGEDGSLESHYLYVPWVDGTPVVSSVVGYTKVSPHGPVLWNKGVASFWPASVRARDEYDSTNPTDWAGRELGAFNLTMDSAGYDTENRVFSVSNPNEYVYLDGNPQTHPVEGTPFVYDMSPLTNVRSVVAYVTKKTSEQAKRFMNYAKKLVGG